MTHILRHDDTFYVAFNLTPLYCPNIGNANPYLRDFDMLNFNEMEMKYGSAVAYQCLVEIEKAARIASHLVHHLTPEIRLSNAIRAQDALADQVIAIAA